MPGTRRSRASGVEKCPHTWAGCCGLPCWPLGSVVVGGLANEISLCPQLLSSSSEAALPLQYLHDQASVNEAQGKRQKPQTRLAIWRDTDGNRRSLRRSPGAASSSLPAQRKFTREYLHTYRGSTPGEKTSLTPPTPQHAQQTQTTALKGLNAKLTANVLLMKMLHLDAEVPLTSVQVTRWAVSFGLQMSASAEVPRPKPRSCIQQLGQP